MVTKGRKVHRVQRVLAVLMEPKVLKEPRVRKVTRARKV
jgi:hypothetical protein